MRIGQIVHAYYPHMGGIEYYVHRLKEFLARTGDDVTVYTTNLGIKENDSLDEDAFYCNTDFSMLRNPFSMELIKRVRKSEQDIYHLHSPWFIVSLFASMALDHKPKVMTVHSAAIESKDTLTLLLNKGYHLFAKRVLTSMDALIVQGNEEKKRLVGAFGLDSNSIRVIPNGIDIEDFSEQRDMVSLFIKRYGIAEEAFKILFVSRLVEEKNPIPLISAVTKHLPGEDIEVIMIGEGSSAMISELKDISDRRIHVVGKVGFDQLVAAYHLSDLFVFLGTWEGMPTVILEAMACGLPVVTTDVGAIPDVVEEGKNGFFVDIPVEASKLATMIKWVLNEVDLERIGRYNAEKISKFYSMGTVATQIRETYCSAFEGR